MNPRFFLIGLFALVLGIGMACAETPTQAVDKIWNTWIATTNHDERYAKNFRAVSRTAAHEQGVAIIAPIMARAKDWKSEEVLIFVAAVAFLPQDQAVPILKRYKKEGKPWERQAADDLLIELDSPDLKEMMKNFRNE